MRNSKINTPITAHPDDIIPITEAVVTAGAEGAPQIELPPLATVVDPDALGTFLTSTTNWVGEPTAAVEFASCGYEVTITADGITVSKEDTS